MLKEPLKALSKYFVKKPLPRFHLRFTPLETNNRPKPST